MRIALAALLGAAALGCAGLWIADALSPPRPPSLWYLSGRTELLRLEPSGGTVIVWLANARLELWSSTHTCWYCAHFLPEHAADCTAATWGTRITPPGPPRTERGFAVPGLAYSDEWAAPAGLLSANLYVSLWLLIALLAPYPLYVLVRGLLQRHSRRRPGVCAACGYDLTGNVSGMCPECGRPAMAAR